MTQMLVLETANNPGNAVTIALNGAPTGYRTWLTAVGSGAREEYVMRDGTGLYEWGIGYPTAAAPNTFTRETVLGGSSGAGVRVNFTGQVDIYSDFIPDRVASKSYADARVLEQKRPISGAWPSTNFDPGTGETIIFNLDVPPRTRSIVGQVTVNGLAGDSAATLTCPVYLLNASGNVQAGPIIVPNRASANNYGQANFPITFAIGAGLVGASTAWKLRFNAYRNAAFTMLEYAFNGEAICEAA